MSAVLKWLSLAMGITCVAIGLVHLIVGISSFPDMGEPAATADSQSRFFGAVFAGYGAAWIWAARQSPIPAPVVRWLAAIMLLGALGRFLSMAVYGIPHWFAVVLTVVEVVLPPVYIWLSTADEKRLAAPAAG